MEEELLTVAEAAARAGVPEAQAKRLVLSGRVATRIVEVEGRLEVRVEPGEVERLAQSAEAGSPEESVTGDGNVEPPASGADDSTELTGTGTSALASPEIRQLAAGLADELFQRWELAMQGQFRAELKVRLQSELEHRRRQAEDLQEEVAQREEQRFGPGGTKVVGMADRYATWERERALTRQSRELAEIERQMSEMRRRLEDLGVSDQSTITVDREQLEEDRHPDSDADGTEEDSP